MSSNDITRGTTVPGTNDGSFAPKHQPEAEAAGIFLTGGRVFAALQDATGNPEDEISEAITIAGITDPDHMTPEQEQAARKCLSAFSRTRANNSRLSAAYDGYRKAKQEMVDSSLKGAALYMAAWHPDATALVLNNDEEGGWYWEASDANGNPIDIDGATDDLWEMGGGIEHRDRFLVEPWCVGYQADSEGWASGLQTDRDGLISRAELDLAKILDQA